MKDTIIQIYDIYEVKYSSAVVEKGSTISWGKVRSEKARYKTWYNEPNNSSEFWPEYFDTLKQAKQAFKDAVIFRKEMYRITKQNKNYEG